MGFLKKNREGIKWLLLLIAYIALFINILIVNEAL